MQRPACPCTSSIRSPLPAVREVVRHRRLPVRRFDASITALHRAANSESFGVPLGCWTASRSPLPSCMILYVGSPQSFCLQSDCVLVVAPESMVRLRTTQAVEVIAHNRRAQQYSWRHHSLLCPPQLYWALLAIDRVHLVRTQQETAARGDDASAPIHQQCRRLGDHAHTSNSGVDDPCQVDPSESAKTMVRPSRDEGGVV